jgi:hypothetical protein
MREEAQRGDFIEVADLFLRLPLPTRREFFATHFAPDKEAMTQTQRLLASLPARHWFTTNFDPFMRYALAEKSPSVEVFGNAEEELKAVLGLWSRKHFGVHLHGKADLYESLVFATSSYAEIRGCAPYREILKRAFTECDLPSEKWTSRA